MSKNFVLILESSSVSTPMLTYTVVNTPQLPTELDFDSWKLVLGSILLAEKNVVLHLDGSV